MSGPRASRVVLAAACLALLAGCSNTQVVGGDRAVHIALSEYRLNPDSVRVSTGTLTIYVRNYGRMTHNLVVSRSGVVAGSTKPLWPGQSAALTLTLLPGTYSMASTVLSDEALGDYGTLKVTS